MEQNYFSDVVKDICRSVSGKQKRAEIEEELMGHLEDTFERNKAIGKSDEEAEKAAVEALGDIDVMRQRLGAVHSFSHAKALSSSIWMFIISFLLMKFNILDFLALGAVQTFIAQALAVLAFVRLRTANKKLNIAFFACSMSFLLTACYKSIIVSGQSTVVMYVDIVISGILNVVFWYCSFAGLRELHARFCPDDEKKPHLALPMLLLPLGSAVSTFLVVLNEGEGMNFDGFIVFSLFIIFYIFTAVQLVRVNNRLWDADAEYGISPWNKKTVTAAVAIVAFCIICPVSFMYADAVREPDVSELVIHDTENSAEADAVRKYIREELGFGCEPGCEITDDDFLEELPDSEIMRYKDAKYLAWSAQIANEGVYHIYDFYFNDEDTGDIRVRTLIRLYVADERKQNRYKNGFYYKYSYYNWVFIPVTEPEIYASVLYQRNGKAYAFQPEAKDLNDEDVFYDDRNAVGFEYPAENGMVIWFAITNGVGAPYASKSMSHAMFIVKQNNPIALTNGSMRDYAKSLIRNGYIELVDDLSFSFEFLADPNMYEPEYLGLDDLSDEADY